MKHHIEEDGWFFYPEQGLKENKVPGATDGKKFRDPLNDSEKDGLEDINFKAPLIQ
jgi:hypothetical protein